LTSAPPDEREPLLLDTPVPEPANDWLAPSGAGTVRAASAAAELAFAAAAGSAIAGLALGAQALTITLALAICAVAALGFGVAIWRRWALAVIVVIAALYVAFGAAMLRESLSPALALLSIAAVGGAAIGLRAPGGPATRFDWRPVRARAPSAIIATSGILAALVWLAASQSAIGSLAGPAWVSLMFVALAGAGVRARIVAPQALAAVTLGLLFGVVGYLRARFPEAPVSSFYLMALAAGVVVALAASLARPHRASRALVAGFGATGAALLFVIAAFSRPDWHSVWAWGPLAAGAACLFVGAGASAREAKAPNADRAVDLWSVGAVALVLVAVESAITPLLRPVADTAIAYGLARASIWRDWRGLRLGALGAGAVAVISAASLAGAPSAGALAALAAAAGLLWLAARIPRLEGRLSDGLGAVATIATALALLIWLSWRVHALSFDTLTASGLYAIGLIGFGLLAGGRGGGALARWRTPLLIGAGIVCAMVGGGLIANPWWGARAVGVDGGPVLNTMLLGFGFPALLAGFASTRVSAPKWALDAMAVSAGALVLLWATLEIRRGFHGALMDSPPVGPIEGALCAALLLGAAVGALQASSRWRGAGVALAWVALGVSALLMLWSAHPLWGATARPVLLGDVVLQLCAAFLAMLLARRAQSLRRPRGLDAAACAAALAFVWSAGHMFLAWAGQLLFAPMWPLALVVSAWRWREALGVRALAGLAAVLVWPTLGAAAYGLWASLNPWWGAAPISTQTPYAAFGLASYGAAAWLSHASAGVHRARAAPWLRRTTLAMCVLHAWIGATLVARRWFHVDMTHDGVFAGEALAMATAWAIVGVTAFWFGMRRGGSAITRWLGITALASSAGYALFTMATRFTGVAQAWLLAGLFAIVAATMWFAATYRPRRTLFARRLF
jgi:hypothetical protein